MQNVSSPRYGFFFHIFYSHLWDFTTTKNYHHQTRPRRLTQAYGSQRRATTTNTGQQRPTTGQQMPITMQTNVSSFRGGARDATRLKPQVCFLRYIYIIHTNILPLPGPTTQGQRRPMQPHDRPTQAPDSHARQQWPAQTYDSSPPPPSTLFWPHRTQTTHLYLVLFYLLTNSIRFHYYLVDARDREGKGRRCERASSNGLRS